MYILIPILQHTKSTKYVFTSQVVKTDLLRSVISMDQQSVVRHLSLKGLDAIEMCNDLIATIKGMVKSYSTVTYYLRMSTFSSPKTPQPSESPAPILNESDEAIFLALSEEPFASVRRLVGRTHLHPSTVYDHTFTI
jgi:hypothetical protein